MAYTVEQTAILQRFRGQHHGGLSYDVVRLSGTRKGAERLRSTPDVRLFEAMTAEQTEAFLRIGDAHGIMNAGMGVQGPRYEMVDGNSGLGALHYGAGLIVHYRNWHEYCKPRGIYPLMAEDVIVFGLSMNESAKERRTRKTTVKLNLFACLDAWWAIR